MVKKGKYKLGLQLFSIQNEMETNPISSLKAAKAMGYEDFETYGFDAERTSLYGFKPAAFKTVLEDLQLTTSSGHFDFSPFLNKPASDMQRYVDQCILAAQIMGMKYITWPWLPPAERTPDGFKRLAAQLNSVGEQIKAAQLGFAYHNHGFEFKKQFGHSGFDIILSETDASLVKLQMDLFWVLKAAQKTPKQLIENHPGRYVMWHLKDRSKVNGQCTEMGMGELNFADVIPDPQKSGLEFYYLEQEGNYANSPLKSAADSAAFFKKHVRPYF